MSGLNKVMPKIKKALKRKFSALLHDWNSVILTEYLIYGFWKLGERVAYERILVLERVVASTWVWKKGSSLIKASKLKELYSLFLVILLLDGFDFIDFIGFILRKFFFNIWNKIKRKLIGKNYQVIQMRLIYWNLINRALDDSVSKTDSTVSDPRSIEKIPKFW